MSSSSRLALITGGSRGIGRATALALARDGRDVIITYRSHSEEADEVAAAIAELGRTAVALQLDTGALDSFDAFAATFAGALRETWGRETFDFLVNNGGMQIAGSFAAVTQQTLTASSTSTSRASSSSLKSSLDCSPTTARSSTSRPARPASTPPSAWCMRRRRAPSRCSRDTSLRSSGHAASPSTRLPRAPSRRISATASYATTSKVQQVVSSVTALRRYAVAKDIGGAIAALLGDGNRWVTGQRIEVSGGVHL
jgi:NAD(P)-dependent dehydrogenase (short-subunit alcohol dehydrogenase family)